MPEKRQVSTFNTSLKNTAPGPSLVGVKGWMVPIFLTVQANNFHGIFGWGGGVLVTEAENIFLEILFPHMSTKKLVNKDTITHRC